MDTTNKKRSSDVEQPLFILSLIHISHVVASTKFAAKCEEAGVDAIVAEGFEAGGHNGLEVAFNFAFNVCPLVGLYQIPTSCIFNYQSPQNS